MSESRNTGRTNQRGQQGSSGSKATGMQGLIEAAKRWLSRLTGQAH